MALIVPGKIDAFNKGLQDYDDIFNAGTGEIDFLDVINSSECPVIDLHPLRKLYKSDGKSELPAVLLKPFLQLEPVARNRVRFIGDKGDVEKLLGCIPDARESLLSNPSIAKILELDQSKSDFRAAPPSEKLNEMIKNGNAVITQSSGDLFESIFADSDKSDNG